MLRRFFGCEAACRDFKFGYHILQRPCAIPKRNMPAGTEAAVETNPQPPKLSAAEFSVYHHMAEHMEYYVSGVRSVSGRGG